MSKFNIRAAPPPGLFDSDGPTRETHIMSLPVSLAWKTRFLLIDKAGGASLPSVLDLDRKDQLKVKWNVIAFLTWPAYYVYLGMWKKGVFAALLAIVAVLLVSVLLKGFGLGIVTPALWLVPGVYFAARANVDYYRIKVLGERDGEALHAFFNALLNK